MLQAFVPLLSALLMRCVRKISVGRLNKTSVGSHHTKIVAGFWEGKEASAALLSGCSLLAF